MADQEPAIHLQCDRSGDGWRCRVRVGNDSEATTHEVEVADRDLARIAPNAEVERLVEASFRFLLEREPREAILRRFELPVIGRYFPDYAAEIGRRL